MFQCEWCKKIKLILIYIGIWILVFQSYLEQIWEPARYTDELIALLGGLMLLAEFIKTRGIRASKDTWLIACLLIVFVMAGVLGNYMYQYQPIKAIIIDLVANTKFYFSILMGYYLFKEIQWDELKRHVCVNSRIITLFIFILFVLDQILDIYWGEIRYGLKSATMIFFHSTYLAGLMAFLLVMLTVFYQKNNLIYIGMSVVVMAMTLRSKAIASAMVYVILFYVITTFKKRIKITDIVLLGMACIIVAWPMIEFYFIALGGWSARSVMLNTSFEIMKDYFPIGTGFATYGTDMAREYYSPVYVKYGFMELEELRVGSLFLVDSFWPIVIGQTGFIGTIAYLGVVYILLKKIIALFHVDKHFLIGALFILIYILIASTAEPIFNNSVAIPLAVVLGIMFKMAKTKN